MQLGLRHLEFAGMWHLPCLRFHIPRTFLPDHSLLSLGFSEHGREGAQLEVAFRRLTGWPQLVNNNGYCMLVQLAAGAGVGWGCESFSTELRSSNAPATSLRDDVYTNSQTLPLQELGYHDASFTPSYNIMLKRNTP